jgi:hypothetical protein
MKTMMSTRQMSGFLVLVAAAIVVGYGYTTMPSAGACRVINQMQQSLGLPNTCSTTPPIGWFVAAGVIALIGVLLVLAPSNQQGDFK